jgi:hypothetical protein
MDSSSISPVASFLSNLRLIKDNHAFLALLATDFTFLNRLNNFMRDQPEALLSDIKVKILEYAEAHGEPSEYLGLIEALYVIYVRENVTGPSVYTRYVEEEKRPLQKDEPLPEKDTDPISNKNISLQEKLVTHFERDSEQIFLKTQFLLIFFSIETLLMNVPDSFKEKAN